MTTEALFNVATRTEESIGFADGVGQFKDRYRIRIMQESDTAIFPGPPPIHPSVLKIDVVAHRSYFVPLFNNDAVGGLKLALNGMHLNEVVKLVEVAKVSGRDIASFISSEWREAPRGSFTDDDLVQLSELCSSTPSGRFEGTGEPGAPGFIVVNFAGYEKRFPISRETAPALIASLADECKVANDTINDATKSEPYKDAAKMFLVVAGGAIGSAAVAHAITGGAAGMPGIVIGGAIGLALGVFEAVDIAKASADNAMRDKANREAKEKRESVHCKPDNRSVDVGRRPDPDKSPPRSGGGGGSRSFLEP